MEKMAARGKLGSFFRFSESKMLLVIFMEKLENIIKLWYNIIKESKKEEVKSNGAY